MGKDINETTCVDVRCVRIYVDNDKLTPLSVTIKKKPPIIINTLSECVMDSKPQIPNVAFEAFAMVTSEHGSASLAPLNTSQIVNTTKTSKVSCLRMKLCGKFDFGQSISLVVSMHVWI